MKSATLPGLFSVPATVQMSPVAAEKRRLNAAALRVLAALKAAGETGMTNVELCAPAIGGMRFGARLFELKADGWRIETTHEHDGVWRSVLKGYR